jgi:hypothetical protein
MAHVPNPFDFAGTVDTSGYGSTTQTEAFGATGTSIDPGQVTPGARSVITPSCVADVVPALDSDANLTTVASNRTAWLAEVNRMSAAYLTY